MLETADSIDNDVFLELHICINALTPKHLHSEEKGKKGEGKRFKDII